MRVLIRHASSTNTQARVFALANHFRPSNWSLPALSPVAQEPLNVIEYTRLGDEYK